MKKRKMILRIAATAAVMVLCAGLPKLTAKFMDKQGTEEAPVYSDIHPVELEITQHPEKPEDSPKKESLPMIAKLSLCANGKLLYIDEINATKTPEEIDGYIAGFLAASQRAGFLVSFQPTIDVITCRLLYDAKNSSNFIVVWTYYAQNYRSNGVNEVELMIDDETGKILSYKQLGAFVMDGWERNRKIVDAFTDVYFAQLDLTEKAEEIEALPGTLYHYKETDMGITEVHYTILDPACGTVKITFLVGGVDTFQIMVKSE